MPLSYLRHSAVHEFTPKQVGFGTSHSEHTILVDLDMHRDTLISGPIEANPPIEDISRKQLLALTPDDARALARQLLNAAGPVSLSDIPGGSTD